MLVTSLELLEDAKKNHYAVGAFNVENMEMVIAVLNAAEETKSPVIMQTTPGTIKYAGADFYFANIKAAAERASVPVVCHLDHGNNFEIAVSAFHTGYTSIMIDGSKLSFEENISLTKSVVKVCHAGGVPVEAELGRVGGKEDGLDNTKTENPFTDPGEAAEFVERTGCDSLAVAVGTAHGVYKGVPQINFEVLSKIHELVNIPLVLHGTSGVPDEQVIECIKTGVCKVNYATDLRIAFTRGIKEYIKNNPDAFDPKKYGVVAIEEVKKYTAQKMLLMAKKF
ncbi:MAG: class II fructose-bisphosphate aldolase [Synergistales bacterium]|nr:class II fructose-bisphosphate aldolase [Synergistales bacterium]MDY6402117.1 class II fructose-bisphosphate aldolase [Synergistales bacterium]MDY6405222.1 class II fructose-bisphosphate aldolase [Synergistales bacterium]MDY6410620.1 class II fructose-bisphosphate aldolase [Synergistales bacterium]MDY6413893.1 class II fructose-bisphosphate aldolase [Synergistales bacterium]